MRSSQRRLRPEHSVLVCLSLIPTVWPVCGALVDVSEWATSSSSDARLGSQRRSSSWPILWAGGWPARATAPKSRQRRGRVNASGNETDAGCVLVAVSGMHAESA